MSRDVGRVGRIAHFWPLPWTSTRPDDERMVDVLDAHGRSIAHLEWPFHSAEEADEAEQITYVLADIFAAALSDREAGATITDLLKALEAAVQCSEELAERFGRVRVEEAEIVLNRMKAALLRARGEAG